MPQPLATILNDTTTFLNKNPTTNTTTTSKINKNPSADQIRARFPSLELTTLDILKISQAETDATTCKKCTGLPCKKNTAAGFIPTVDSTTARVTLSICKFEAASRRQHELDRRFKAAKIPACYLGKTLDDYITDPTNRDAIAAAREALDKNSSLYIFGNPGTGKTFLASIVAQNFLKNGKTVVFTEVPSLLDTLKSTFDDATAPRIDELTASLSAVDVLILDDLGTESATEWAVERLFLIINNRYNARRTTIVTSNFNFSGAEARLNNPKRAGKIRDAPANVGGTRIISRLAHMCRAVQIGGGDRRIISKFK